MSEQTKAYWIRQGKSFIKTYVTIFLTIYLFQTTNGAEQGQAINLLDWSVIGVSAQWAFIGVLRNVYKILTEDPKDEIVQSASLSTPDVDEHVD